jgi:hypothetical protein
VARLNQQREQRAKLLQQRKAAPARAIRNYNDRD